jgi:AcrR family transcriptional regulator
VELSHRKRTGCVELSSAEHDPRSSVNGRGSRRIAPLYRRLPKGPHGLTPEEVKQNQQTRIHGGMIRAVAWQGYERTSVRHVIGFAGVSRKAFYELFTNKHECILRTFDLILARATQRIVAACKVNTGSVEMRIQAGLEVLVEELERNPEALRLVMVESLAAGRDGRLALARALSVGEQLLAHGLAAPPTEHPLPAPLVRAVAGGLRRVVLAHLQREHDQARASFADEMLVWTLLFAAPEISDLQIRPSPHPVQSAAAQPPTEACDKNPDHRTRVLRGAVDVLVRERYEEITVIDVADEAGVPIDVFFEYFESFPDCYLATLDLLGSELLEAVADPALVSTEWPGAVCHAIKRFTDHLVQHPVSATVLATKTCDAGIDAFVQVVHLADEVATLLTEGARRRPSPRLAPEFISGALAQMANTEIIAGRGHLLGGLTEHISYVVLAPYLGPDAVLQAILAARETLA